MCVKEFSSYYSVKQFSSYYRWKGILLLFYFFPFNKSGKTCKENTSSVIILGKNSKLYVAFIKIYAKRNFQ